MNQWTTYIQNIQRLIYASFDTNVKFEVMQVKWDMIRNVKTH